MMLVTTKPNFACFNARGGVWLNFDSWLGRVGLRRLFALVSVRQAGNNPNGLMLMAFTTSLAAVLVHAGVSAFFIAPLHEGQH